VSEQGTGILTRSSLFSDFCVANFLKWPVLVFISDSLTDECEVLRTK
jgi:hypothetical protein